MVKNILFVCTGNIYRSMSSEYLCKKYLQDNGITSIHPSSAGIEALPEEIHQHTRNQLTSLGIPNIHHTQRKLSQQIIDGNDIIIVMAQNHADFITENFPGTKFYFFNELAVGEKTSVWDIDTVENHTTNVEGVQAEIGKTISYLAKYIPVVVEKIKRIE